MKLLLFVAISCLALHNGKGAPSKAVYKFVRCNPESDQSNCVAQQTPEMAWSPELPTKLPASAAQYLEAEPVEDEKPDREEGEEMEKEEEGEEPPLLGEEGESPVFYPQEEGSGGFEGSAAGESFMADKAFETGSGASSTEKFFEPQKGESRGKRWLSPSRFSDVEEKPEEKELKEDNLMQL